MTFPTTAVIDDFNRSNEGPPLSSDYTALVNGCEVISNAAAGSTSGGNIDLYDVSTYGPDTECYLTVGTKPTGSYDYLMTLVRMTTLSIGTIDGYLCAHNNESGTDQHYIERVDNGSTTTLGASIAQEYSAGDKMGMEIVDDTITLYYNSGSGWTSLGTRTDSNHSSAGYIGLGVEDTIGRADDFGGGTVVEGAALSIPVAMRYYRNMRT